MIKTTIAALFIDPQSSVPIIDARSEGEFAKGHIPGSINIPLLDDKARKEVGTLYKQMGREAAIMKGLQLVGPRFYSLFKQIRQKAFEKQVRIYCWRGGMRSQILCWLMNLAEYDIQILSGGYKAFRNHIHSLFAMQWKWIVISGKTGVGKTMLLQQLAAEGEQVLDFEGLASHKGSAFGHIGMNPQPTVEHFENLIGWVLCHFDPSKPIWIESESRFIGQVRIPDLLFNQTLNMPIIEVEVPEPVRRLLIMDSYGKQPVFELMEATQRLEKRLGNERTKEACNALSIGDFNGWLDVVLPYYDKTYAHSSGLRKGEVVRFPVSDPSKPMITTLLHVKNQLWKQSEN